MTVLPFPASDRGMLALCSRNAVRYPSLFELGKIRGQRRDLFIVEPPGHHLHHRMRSELALVGVHGDNEIFLRPEGDRRNTLCRTVGAVAGQAFVGKVFAVFGVALDGQDRGKTPLSIPFDYYGERFLELRLREHRVKRTFIDIPTPWYQYFPLDFFFELLWPGTLKDTRSFHFVMDLSEPGEMGEKPAILERADKLRYGEGVKS